MNILILGDIMGPSGREAIIKKLPNLIKKNAISLGIAYSFQRCQKIPTNKHDFKLDYIFTEKGIINSK